MAYARSRRRGEKFPTRFDLGHGTLPVAMVCCA